MLFPITLLLEYRKTPDVSMLILDSTSFLTVWISPNTLTVNSSFQVCDHTHRDCLPSALLFFSHFPLALLILVNISNTIYNFHFPFSVSLAISLLYWIYYIVTLFFIPVLFDFCFSICFCIILYLLIFISLTLIPLHLWY